MNILNAILLASIVISSAYYLFSSFCTRRFFSARKHPPRSPSWHWPPVSIIKPLTRAEAESTENFLSFCDQDYPCFEIVFSLSRDDHAVVNVLEDLRRQFPALEIRWLVVDDNPGPNYKVGNLIAAINAAKYDLIAISDADMRVGPDYLQHIVSELQQQDAGVVTCLYGGIQVRSISSALHALTIQGDFIPNVLVGYRLEGISYAFGATICTWKTVLDSFGGLEPLRNYLADDYQIGYLAKKHGHKIQLSRYLLDHSSSPRKVVDFIHHQLRWAITQRVCRPWGYFASVMTHGVTLATVFLLANGFSLFSTLLFMLTLGVRLASFSYLNAKVIHNAEVARYQWLLPARDLLNSIIWLMSLFMNTVRWKNRRFKVLKGGRMVELA